VSDKPSRPPAKRKPAVRARGIAHLIQTFRGQKVILDEDLAPLYGVTTGNLNKAATRHPKRFPPDFMFRLTNQEFSDLKFQSGSASWGGRRRPPRAYPEQGVAMLSSVLGSPQAVHVNVEIMRAFVRMRYLTAPHEALTQKVEEMGRKQEAAHRALSEMVRDLKKADKRHDASFRAVFDAIRLLGLPDDDPDLTH